MNKLSVVIITKNEEKYIADAIKSVSFADEVLVLDCGSIDKTKNIAKKEGAKVFHQDWIGFGPQKNKGVDLACNDWVFVLDADERVTDNLKKEIIRVLTNPTVYGYMVPRLNYFFGKYIKHCGLYPDYSIRLFNKNKGKFSESPVHEKLIIDGKVSKLKNHMLHLAYETVDEFIKKQKKYASLSNKNRNIFKVIVSPLWLFVKMYFFRLGFLEGWRGFVISKVYAQYTFWKYFK